MSYAAKCQQKYSIGHLYNYKYQIQNLLIKYIPINITSKCPIKKIIRLIVNLLKINQFQSVLLSWLINKINWEHMQKQIQKISKHLNNRKIQQKNHLYYQSYQNKYTYNQRNCLDYLVPNGILQDNFDKTTFLLLLLHGYNVKSFLLTPGTQIDIDPDIFSSVPFFDQIYENWKPQKSLKLLSLPQINKIFQNSMIESNIYANKKKVDYNRIVDKILFLSKTYNVGANIIDQNKSCLNPKKQQKSQISQININLGNEARKKRKTIYQKVQQKNQKFNEHQYSSKNEQKQAICKQIYGFSPNKNQAKCIQWFQDDRNNQLNRSLRRSMRTLNRSIFDVRDGFQDLTNGNTLNLNNQSMIRSYNSNGSNHNQEDLFGSLKRVNTRNNFMNNSFNNINLNSNNGLNFSYGGAGPFGNVNSSTIGNINNNRTQNSSNQLLAGNSLFNSIFDPSQTPNSNNFINTKNSKKIKKQENLSSLLIPTKNNTNKKKDLAQSFMKLKATDSFDQKSEQHE